MNNVANDDNLDPEISSLLKLTPAGKEKSENKDTNKGKNDKPTDTTKFLDTLLKNVDTELADNLIKAKGLFDNPLDKTKYPFYKDKLKNLFLKLHENVLINTVNSNIDYAQLLFLRFNILDINYISQKQFELIKSIVKSYKHTSIFYIDEWFYEIKEAQINNSTTDELDKDIRKPEQVTLERIKQRKGQKESELSYIETKIREIMEEESNLKTFVKHVLHQPKQSSHENTKIKLIKTYQKEQKRDIVNIFQTCRMLLRKDKEISKAYKILSKIDAELASLEGSRSDKPLAALKNKVNIIEKEIETTRRMLKISIGKQGNHFPILLGKYIGNNIGDIASKDNVQKLIYEFEKIDYTVFVRSYKGVKNHVLPYFIIMPCYGDKAICWEAIPKQNRAIGKGTIAVPLFPKRLDIAILKGIGDFRWETAKDKAGYHWMEEGLTGHYYDYYMKEKLKGNIKDFFIADYIIWINFESKGKLKLNKAVRELFWRRIPFTEEAKEKLSDHSNTYSELYIKEKLREQSRGY